MITAIQQPYVFPYIGYFKLIHVADNFIFYDDVSFIKKGWIHRNNILVNGQRHLFSIPCIKASQNKLIKEIIVDNDIKKLKKVLKTIKSHYSKAPNFNLVYPIIEETFLSIDDKTSISELAIKSVLAVCKYLEIDSNFSVSSIDHKNSRALKKEKRLIQICKEKESSIYINSIGGTSLYNKKDFNENEIQLLFLKPLVNEYKQFKNQFISNLSIIDVLMFNTPEKIRQLLNKNELI